MILDYLKAGHAPRRDNRAGRVEARTIIVMGGRGSMRRRM
jgi:hypothetical protein